jgi:hypothetical protein
MKKFLTNWQIFHATTCHRRKKADAPEWKVFLTQNSDIRSGLKTIIHWKFSFFGSTRLAMTLWVKFYSLVTFFFHIRNLIISNYWFLINCQFKLKSNFFSLVMILLRRRWQRTLRRQCFHALMLNVSLRPMLSMSVAKKYFYAPNSFIYV